MKRSTKGKTKGGKVARKKVYTTENVKQNVKKNETIILHLNSNISTDLQDSNNENPGDIECLYTSRINSRLKEDKDIVNKLKNTESELNEVNIDDIMNSLDENKNKEGNNTLYHILSEFSEWNSISDKSCWNCSEIFNKTPIGLPIHINKDGTIRTRGIFCSFPCILRYIRDRKTVLLYKPNILYMFKILTDGNTVPKEAPPLCALQKFGGKLSIEEYRGNVDKIYNYIQYPMYIVKDYIHEVEISNIKKNNDYLFKT